MTEQEYKTLVIKLTRAGDLDRARQLTAAYSGERVSPLQLGERGEMVARAKAIGMDPKDLFVPEQSQGSKFLADLDYGLEQPAFGAEQLLRHVVPGMDTEGIDAAVQEREQSYQDSGLADELTGGRLAAGITTSLGLGGIHRAQAPIRSALAIGAVE